MRFVRLAPYVLLLPALAACGDAPAPPAPQEPAASAPSTPAAAPASPAPAAPAAASTPAAGPAPSAETLAPVTGAWSADLAGCTSPNAVVEITAERFEGYENSCAFTAMSDDGSGNITATMSCEAEGATTDERVLLRPLFAPTGEGLELSYLDRDGEPVTLLRCNAQ